MPTLISVIGFGEGDKRLLGGKGFYLDRRAKQGYPVPPGFTITTDGFRDWQNNEQRISTTLEEQIRRSIVTLEERTGRIFITNETSSEIVAKKEDDRAPLFVSARSGAESSMPGMMDTLCNIGSNRESIAALARDSGNSTFAYQIYRTFIEHYCKIVRAEEVDLDSLAKKIEIPPLLQWFNSFCGGDLFPLLDPQKYEERQLPRNYIKKSIFGQDYDDFENYQIRQIREIRTPARDIYSFFQELDREKHLLTRRSVFEGIAKGYAFTGVAIEDLSTLRRGKIELITERYLSIRWDNAQLEEISINRLDKEKRTRRELSIHPQIILDVERYQRERETIGQLIPDTLRISHHLEDKIEDDPQQQVLAAVDAVFQSWYSPRAREYRAMHSLSEESGTAVTIQQMVFGNKTAESGTAVLFSSCPKTGEQRLRGEYLLGQQGENIVSGDVTPLDIDLLKQAMPKMYHSLDALAAKVELDEETPQDLEVTWEDPERGPFLLQTREAKLSPRARVSYALRRVNEGKQTEEEMLRRTSLEDFMALTSIMVVDVPAEVKPLTNGKSNLGGVVSGHLVFDREGVTRWRGQDSGKIIYASKSTTTDDIALIRDCDAIITTTGGAYSHAAVVALGLQKICVAGCGGTIENAALTFAPSRETKTTLKEGELITIDGYSGDIYLGAQAAHPGRQLPEVQAVLASARRVTNHLPLVYEAQCADDLKELERILSEEQAVPRRSTILYLIDFDCLNATGFFKQERRSKREAEMILNEGAGEIANQLAVLQERNGQPVLAASLDYDSTFQQLGHNAAHLRRDYLKLIKTKTNLPWKEISYSTSLPTEIPLLSRMTKSINIQPPERYVPPQCVRIRPWSIEESYFTAAKEVLAL